ncbi:MAG: hypothetical protein WAQ52_10350 [Terriglobales bacterium]
MIRTLGLAISLLFTIVAGAQDASAPKTLIPLLILDSHHRPVPGVTAASLAITEHKVPITNSVNLLTGPALPLQLGVLIDTSNSESTAGMFFAAVKAVNDFVRESMRTGDDRVFFEPFSNKPEMTAWLSKEQLAGESLHLKIGGGTALYDAIAVACADRMGNADRQKPARRVLVVISDGDDNLSDHTRDQAASLLIGGGVVMFAVSTGPRQKTRGEQILTWMANASGGSSFVSLTAADMPRVFATIRALMDGMYYLSYVPPEPLKKGVHEVEVRPAQGSKFEVSYPRKYLWNP